MHWFGSDYGDGWGMADVLMSLFMVLFALLLLTLMVLAAIWLAKEIQRKK